MRTEKLGISFDNALSHEPVDKRIDILRLIGESGSISQAAREAKVSYKAAWQALDTLTNLAGITLVERAVGGSGGGANITLAGHKLLSIAELLYKNRRAVFSSFDSNALMLPRAMPMLSSLDVRTSLRNQIPCTIEKLEVLGQVVRVHLWLGGETKLMSCITKASVQLLGLKKEQRVLALCKATAIVVSTELPLTHSGKTPTAQHLRGHAVRISRSKSGDEVSVQLDGGVQLVGFAKTGSGLKVKGRVTAQVDESAVVIALSS